MIARHGDPWRRVGAVFLAVLTAFAVLPMMWMLLTSIKTQFAALQFPPEWIPHSPTLANHTPHCCRRGPKSGTISCATC